MLAAGGIRHASDRRRGRVLLVGALIGQRLLAFLQARIAALHACAGLLPEAAPVLRGGGRRDQACDRHAQTKEAEESPHNPHDSSSGRRPRLFPILGLLRGEDQERIARTAGAISSGAVTGSEQRSPTQTNAAAPRALLSFSCAGCAAGSASVARSTMRSRNGSFSAARVSASSPPANTLSAARSRRSSALSSATWPNRLRPAA